jgi:hypothetical protein
MKKLQKLRSVTNGAGFFGGYAKSASVLLCSIALSFIFWTATSSIADDKDKDKDKDRASSHDSGHDSDHDKGRDSGGSSGGGGGGGSGGEEDEDRGKGDCKVCDNDKGKSHTIKMECHDVEKFLREHPEDCRGECPCQPTPVKNP